MKDGTIILIMIVSFILALGFLSDPAHSDDSDCYTAECWQFEQDRELMGTDYAIEQAKERWEQERKNEEMIQESLKSMHVPGDRPWDW